MPEQFNVGTLEACLYLTGFTLLVHPVISMVLRGGPVSTLPILEGLTILAGVIVLVQTQSLREHIQTGKKFLLYLNGCLFFVMVFVGPISVISGMIRGRWIDALFNFLFSAFALLLLGFNTYRLNQLYR